MSDAESDVDRDRLAVALKYERGVDLAPKISAKGTGHIAHTIIALAKEHGIEIREDRDLAQLLAKFEIDTPIPGEAYMAVAEILSYIYRKNNQMKGA